jgi:hypothetical protein
MNLDDNPSAASDESMFGCECALPFLTLRQRTLSGLALGAVVALVGCDGAKDSPPRTAPQQRSPPVMPGSRAARRDLL